MLREVQLRKERWLKEMAMEKDRKESRETKEQENTNAMVRSQTSARGRASESGKFPEKEQVNSAKSQFKDRREEKEQVASEQAMKIQKIKLSSSNPTSMNEHMESYLASQLLSHTCPICFELMKGMERAPVLVFPCGHTFCYKCLQNFQSREGEHRCPACRTTIASWAVNQSLMKLIETFVESRSKMFEQKNNETINPEDGLKAYHPVEVGCHSEVRHIIQYKDKMTSLRTRIQILQNEKKEAENQINETNTRAQAYRRAQRALQVEEQSVLEKLNNIQQELCLVRDHLKEQKEKEKRASEECDKALSKVAMVNTSIEQLQIEYDKVCLILQAKEDS